MFSSKNTISPPPSERHLRAPKSLKYVSFWLGIDELKFQNKLNEFLKNNDTNNIQYIKISKISDISSTFSVGITNNINTIQYGYKFDVSNNIITTLLLMIILLFSLIH